MKFRNHSAAAVGAFRLSLIVLGLSGLLLSGFTTAQQQTSLNARFSLDVSSDSTDVRNRHFTVTQYADPVCSKPASGSKLFRKKFAKKSHSFSQIEIATQAPFFFQVNYLEKRLRGARSCDVLVGFQPQSNRSYHAVYAASGQVSRCGVKVFDVTTSESAEVTELSKPAKTCIKNKLSNNKNAVPVHTIRPLF